MPVARLADRGVLTLSGADAVRFLDGLVTADLDAPDAPPARFAALLSPQGKILFDFFVLRHSDQAGETLFLDCARAQAPELAKRLGFYRLRARVEIADRSEGLAVLAGWDAPPPPADAGLLAPDPRLPELGWRAIVAAGDADEFADAPAEAYHARRVALGAPEAGRDFVFGDAFPHEALMDQLGGVDFRKGCYVGQEVVSRMQHRGTARTRALIARYADGLAPEAGVDVTAGETTIGRTGSAAAGLGIVFARLDRAADALAAGAPIVAGGRPLTLLRPRFATFDAPGVELAPPP